jgi:hypothetical protein
MRWPVPGRHALEGLPVRRVLGSRATTGVALVVGIGLLTLAYRRLSVTVSVNSDDANFVLLGRAVARGNPLLAGWTIPADTFWTTDLPLYAAAALVRGVSPSIVHTVAALVYALLLGATCLLARGRNQGRAAWLPMLLTFALLAVPAHPLGIGLLLEGPYHTGTTLFLLAGVLAVDLGGGRARPLPVAAFGVLLALAVAADPLALYVGALAVAAVSALRLVLLSLDEWRTDAALLAVALAAGVAGTGLRRLVSAVGGYHLLPLPASFAGIGDVPHNMQLALEGWLQLFGADFFGQHAGASAAVPAVRAAGCAFVLVAVLVAIRQWWRASEPDRVTQLLLAVVVVNVAAYVLSTQAIDVRSVRYLVPAICAGAALAGRLSPELLVNQRLRAAAVLVSVGYIALLFAGLRVEPAVQPEAELTSWLSSRGLTYGLGSYWDGASATVTSEDHVRIRPVTATDGRLRPYQWVVDKSWYDPELNGNGARFVVVDPTAYQNVTAATASATFGQPSEVHRVGRYTVLVWQRNLLRELPR